MKLTFKTKMPVVPPGPIVKAPEFLSKPPGVFYDMLRDGVTQSLISIYLSCRQKAKLYLEGWDSRYHSPALIHGSIGHGAFEFAYLDIKSGKLKGAPSTAQARKYVDATEKQWFKENVKPNKEALQYAETSLALMEHTLPIYFDYWKDDFKKKEWISLEEKFRTDLVVPTRSGGQVLIPIRGKKDGTFKASKGTWLFETKFKSMINEGDIVETLSFETQVMLYLLETWLSSARAGFERITPKGVLYNIVRRTSLREKAGENVKTFAARVKADMEKRTDFYFMRMESPTTGKDLFSFQKELVGLLGEMYEWWIGNAPHYKNTYECLGKYGKCVYLPVCARGEYSSLAKRKTMFKELADY